MRPSLPFLLTCSLVVFSTTQNAAAEPSGSAATESEVAVQEKISKLESKLQDARKSVSGLEDELQTARKELVAMQRTSAIPAHFEEPASITSLSAKQLALGGVEDLSRLQYLVPGLRYGQTGHDARLSMRGARTNSIGPEGTSVVAVYEDGVYLPTSTRRLDSFLDIERIDVLRGPQLTTFGQHAYAGAINIVTNKPNFDGFHGYAEFENAAADRTRWRLALNIPIIKTLALRVAGLSESRSGLINNHVLEPDSDDLNDRKEQTIRTSLLWQPSDNFSLLLQRKYQDENGTGTAP